VALGTTLAAQSTQLQCTNRSFELSVATHSAPALTQPAGYCALEQAQRTGHVFSCCSSHTISKLACWSPLPLP